MNPKLVILAVCGCSFLGGLFADHLLCPSGSLAAQGQTAPLPQVPEPEKAHALSLADRFQAVIKQVSPSVVAVDAVKPPNTDPTAKGKPIEESGSGVLVKF